jgi:PKD repeat protein
MRVLLLAVLGLFLLPAVASATPPGQEGRIVLHALAGEGSLSLIEPVPGSTPMFPPALGPAGDVAGSADGQRLAAASVVGSEQLIVVGKHDGTNVTAVPGTQNGFDPTFSPDGQTLAFARGGRIRTIPVTGGTATAVGPTIDELRGLDWSPDGTKIVYVTGHEDEGDADLGVLDVASGHVTPLTDTPNSNEEHPSWSPDGTRILFASSITDSPHGVVRTMADDGTDVQTVTSDANARSAPVYSPTGTRIAYVDDHGHVTARRLAGGGTEQIGDGEQRASSLAWLVKPGTGNQPPTADFSVAPQFPRAGAPAAFTATATDADGTIASYAWDLDGDGAFDDGAAETAQATFPAVGQRTVRLRVRDNVGLAVTVTKQVTVVEAGKPVAFFSFTPEKPVTMDEIVFTAPVNDDPAAVAVRHQWDFDGNGSFDVDTAERRVASFTYGQPGTYRVTLRVTDADGDETDHAVDVAVARATQCGRPFGRMAIAGCVEVHGDRGLARDGLTVNGVTLVAPEGSAIIVDRSAQGNTIRAVDAAVAEEYLRGAGGMPVDARSVAVSVCGERLGSAGLNLTEVSNAARAQSLAVTAAADAAIAGMKISKVGDIAFGAGSATLELEGRFPRVPLSPGATGTYELTNDCDSRKLKIETNDLLLRTIQLTDVKLERIGGGRELKGTLGVRIPIVGPGLLGSVDLSDGAITRLRIAAEDVASLGPGLDVAEISLQLRLRGGNVASVTGGAVVATKGKLFGRRVASTDGYLTVGDGSVRIDGHLNILDMPVGYGYIEAGLGWLDMGVGVQKQLGPAFVDIGLTGYVSVVSPAGINLEGWGRAGFRGIGSVGAEGLVSTKGLGVCGEFDTFLGKVRPGVSFQFAEDILEPQLEDLDLNIFVKGCDLGPIRIARGARVAAADGARVVEMPRGLPSASVQVIGADGPPKVTLVAPNGEKIVTPADDSGRKEGRFILVQDARSRSTTIVAVKPPAGDWRVEPAEGSTAIASVGIAEGLPQPRVTTRVTGKGKRRTLKWRLRSIRGQRVTLLETGRKGSRRLVATNRARGVKRFKPAAGLGSKRRIVAFVEQGGIPRRKLGGARYKVRVVKVTPKRPRSARWSMTADAVRVTFKAAAKLDHEVTVTRADGLQRVELVPAGRRAVSLPGMWAGERIKAVTVRALTADGRRSSPRAARR